MIGPFAKLQTARLLIVANLIVSPIIMYKIDLMLGLVIFPVWASLCGWYVESNLWLPKDIRTRWRDLSSRFGAKRKPEVALVQLSGPAILDEGRSGLAFSADVGANEAGLYVNLRYLGRLWLRWNRLELVRRVISRHPDGPSEFLALKISDDCGSSLLVPWERAHDDWIPKSVAIHD